MNRTNIKKTEKKGFLQDTEAVSPVIATLILIVIAVIAAVAVGYLLTGSQTQTQATVNTGTTASTGQVVIKGSTTILPITQAEIAGYAVSHPEAASAISVSGGGSTTGRALVDNKQVDIGASSDIWQTGSATDSATGLTIGGRETEVLQAGGQNAFVNEQKIGTSMVVVAGNVAGVNAFTVTNTTGYWDATNKTLNINYTDLRNDYAQGYIPSNYVSSNLPLIDLVHRSDDSGTQETFAKWLQAQDSTTKQLNATDSAVGKSAQGNEGVRDYIATHTNSIGFVDVGYVAGGVNGNNAVIPATMNTTVSIVPASKTTKGIGGTYDAASYTVSNNPKVGLARDLYYYSQSGVPTGAVKTFIDYVMSTEGQNILEKQGVFKQ